MGTLAGAEQGGGAHVKHTITVEARRFPVIVQAIDSREEMSDAIILTKQELQAAEVVGESSKELISRHFARKGRTVLDIGKPERRTLTIDLDALWERVM